MRAPNQAPLQRFQRWVDRLWLNIQGQDLIEYALLAGFVAVIIGATIPTRVLPSIQRIYVNVETMLQVWAR